MSSSEDNKEVTTSVKIDEDKFNKLGAEVAELKVSMDKLSLDISQKLQQTVSSLHELYIKKTDENKKTMMEYIDGPDFKKTMQEYLKSEEAKVNSDLETQNANIFDSNLSNIYS